MEEESITEQIKELKRQMEATNSRPPKQFRLPISSVISRGKVLRREWVHVMMIRTNGSMQIKTCKVEDDTVKFGDYFYDARAGNILRWKKMPVLVLKEWNISPEAPPDQHTLNLNEDFKETVADGKLTAAQKLILTKLRMEAIKPKMQLNMSVILIILAVIGGGYFIMQSLGMV